MPQQNYYNDVPFGDMLFEGKAGDDNSEFTGSLMDTSINNAAFEFGFPVEFFLDMLCRYGVKGIYSDPCSPRGWFYGKFTFFFPLNSDASGDDTEIAPPQRSTTYPLHSSSTRSSCS